MAFEMANEEFTELFKDEYGESKEIKKITESKEIKALKELAASAALRTADKSAKNFLEEIQTDCEISLFTVRNDCLSELEMQLKAKGVTYLIFESEMGRTGVIILTRDTDDALRAKDVFLKNRAKYMEQKPCKNCKDAVLITGVSDTVAAVFLNKLRLNSLKEVGVNKMLDGTYMIAVPEKYQKQCASLYARSMLSAVAQPRYAQYLRNEMQIKEIGADGFWTLKKPFYVVGSNDCMIKVTDTKVQYMSIEKREIEEQMEVAFRTIKQKELNGTDYEKDVRIMASLIPDKKLVFSLDEIKEIYINQELKIPAAEKAAEGRVAHIAQMIDSLVSEKVPHENSYADKYISEYANVMTSLSLRKIPDGYEKDDIEKIIKECDKCKVKMTVFKEFAKEMDKSQAREEEKKEKEIEHEI